MAFRWMADNGSLLVAFRSIKKSVSVRSLGIYLYTNHHYFNASHALMLLNHLYMAIFLYLHDSYITKFEFMNYAFAKLVGYQNPDISLPTKAKCIYSFAICFIVNKILPTK